MPKLLGKGPSLILLALAHTLEKSTAQTQFRSYARRYLVNRGQARLVFLTNTPAEAEFVRSTGLEAVFLNHNAFIDERLFFIEPQAEKRYLAIYDAQLHPFKRHWLAAEVPDLALISYMYRPSPDMAYARAIRRQLAGAHWFNDPLASDYRRLSSDEIRRVYNAARVGLCLSESEGAMYASIQYLLCGLPVVSTKNLGGRDEYFHPDYTRTVPDDPKAIAAAVHEMARLQVPASEIRSRTLARMEADRVRFVALVQEFLDAHGVKVDFAAQFRVVFFNTLVRLQKLNRRTLAKHPIDAGKASTTPA